MWAAFITNRGLSCLNGVLVVNVTFDTGLHVGVDGRTDGHDQADKGWAVKRARPSKKV